MDGSRAEKAGAKQLQSMPIRLTDNRVSNFSIYGRRLNIPIRAPHPRLLSCPWRPSVDELGEQLLRFIPLHKLL